MDGADKQNGLVFYPAQHQVTVGTAPVLDLVFSQALVKVRGTVSCVNPPCPTSLTVQLSAVGRPGKHDQTLSKAAGFEFSNVLPGTYKVSAIKDDWCWEQSSITVQVLVTGVLRHGDPGLPPWPMGRARGSPWISFVLLVVNTDAPPPPACAPVCTLGLPPIGSGQPLSEPPAIVGYPPTAADHWSG